MNSNSLATPSVSPLTSHAESRLVGPVSIQTPSFLKEVTSFRRYGTTTRVDASYDGKMRSNHIQTLYRVGMKSDKFRDDLKSDHAAIGVIRSQQMFTYLPALSQALAATHRTMSNYTGEFKTGDLSGMLHRLGMFVGAYAVRGELNHSDCLGGSILNVRAVATATVRVSSSDRTVYIPQSATDCTSRPDVFAALVLAANSAGSAVYTDTIAVDGNNAVSIDFPSGGDLAHSSYEAARTIIAMMSSCGAGATAVFAFTAGLHCMLTVVGHSDEGAYIRDVLRTVRFVAPYGGIFSPSVTDYVGMSAPVRGEPTTMIAAADGIALVTAACSALADPCVTLNNMRFPTVVCCTVPPQPAENSTPEMYARAEKESALAISRSLASSINNVCGPFSLNYCTEIARTFQVSASDAATPAAALRSAFGVRACDSKVANRHLSQAVVSPYYWIEPTSLFDKVDDSSATASGFGVMCGVSQPVTRPYFEQVSVMSPGSCVSQIVVLQRSARVSGAVLLHKNAGFDGMASMAIRQASPEAFVLPGGASPLDMRERMANPVLSQMANNLWNTGDAGLPHPSELINTKGTLGLRVTHQTFEDWDNPTYSSVASALEFASTVVTVSTSRPQFVGQGVMGSRTRDVKDWLSLGARALQDVQMRMGGTGVTGGETWPVSYSAPVVMFDTNSSNIDSGVVRETVPVVVSPTVTAHGPTMARITHDQPLRPQHVNRPPGTVSGTAASLAAATTAARMAAINLIEASQSTTEMVSSMSAGEMANSPSFMPETPQAGGGSAAVAPAAPASQ